MMISFNKRGPTLSCNLYLKISNCSPLLLRDEVTVINHRPHPNYCQTCGIKKSLKLNQSDKVQSAIRCGKVTNAPTPDLTSYKI